MPKSEAVQTPTTDRQRRERNRYALCQRLRSWATAIENGHGAGVTIALRAWADRLDPRLKGKA
jgi:hypothetical protein